MGTRKSKHNRGRKPLYKEHGVLAGHDAKRDVIDLDYTRLNQYGQPIREESRLQEIADEILRVNGNSDLADRVRINDPEIVRIFTAGRVVTGGEVYEPQAAKEYQAPKPHPSLKAKYFCSVCDKPRSYGSAGVCRACYSRKAVANFEKELEAADSRATAFQDRFAVASYWMEAYDNCGFVGFSDAEHRAEWGRCEKDFAPDLVDAISEQEEALDLPIAYWRLHPYLFEGRPRKGLFFARDFLPKSRKQDRVRIDPKSRAARGALLKAAA